MKRNWLAVSVSLLLVLLFVSAVFEGLPAATYGGVEVGIERHS